MPQLIVTPQMQTLHELLRNGVEYSVPSFQRDYTWGPEEWGELWDDICALEEGGQQAKNERQIGQHYMGYLVLQRQDSRKFVIVDGQQRIATLCLLALATAECIESNAIKDEILSRYLYVKDVPDLTRRSRLNLNEINAPFYRQHLLEQNFKSSVSREHLSNQKMHKAFVYFREQIQRKFGEKDADGKVSKFLDRQVGDGLLFTVLNVEDYESAFTIFETLNARGVELSSPDLLKNHLFSVVHDSGSDSDMKQLEQRWQQASNTLSLENMTTFLRHYWIARGGALVRKKNLYRAIRRELNDGSLVFGFVREMTAASDLYAQLRRPAIGDWNSEQEQYLSRLALYHANQQYPLLLAAQHDKWDNKEFTKLVRYCSVIVFRWTVIGGLNPSDLETAFSECVSAVLNGARKSSELLPTLKKVYLSDSRFLNSFSEFTVSTRNRKNLAKHILFEIEHQMSREDYRVQSAKYSLEHIVPENPEDGWDEFDNRVKDLFLWRLGNLALLDSKANKRIGNQPFAEKRAVYKSSSFKITQGCAEYDEWTPREINQRQREMATIASAIWRIDFPKD